jgi:hypothetical protein
MFFLWWWVLPFAMLFALRRGRRWGYRRGWEGQRFVAELQRTVDDQREHIDQLETRLSRVEEGLDFAERLLAERAGGAGQPAASH